MDGRQRQSGQAAAPGLPGGARSWEWRYLNQLSRRELDSVQGPDNIVNALAVSPDGKSVASGGLSYTVSFWDSTSGQATHVLGEKFQPEWLEFNPDATLLVSVGWIPAISTWSANLWDAKTGKKIKELNKYQGAGRGFATFSPDGRWLALAVIGPGSPGDVTLWDARAREPKPLQTLKGATGKPVFMAFSPDSRRLAYVAYPPLPPRSETRPGQLKIWETETGKALLSMDDLPYPPNEGVAFSPDGKQLALAADNRAVHVLRLGDRQGTRGVAGGRCQPSETGLQSRRQAPRLQRTDGIVQLWDPASHENVRSLRGDSALMALAFSPDGRRLTTWNHRNRVAVWDPHTGQDPLTLKVKSLPIRMALSPDGQRLACGMDNGSVTIWDPATGQQLLTLHGQHNKARASPSARTALVLASASLDGDREALGSHDRTAPRNTEARSRSP